METHRTVTCTVHTQSTVSEFSAQMKNEAEQKTVEHWMTSQIESERAVLPRTQN